MYGVTVNLIGCNEHIVPAAARNFATLGRRRR